MMFSEYWNTIVKVLKRPLTYPELIYAGRLYFQNVPAPTAAVLIIRRN